MLRLGSEWRVQPAALGLKPKAARVPCKMPVWDELSNRHCVPVSQGWHRPALGHPFLGLSKDNMAVHLLLSS